MDLTTVQRYCAACDCEEVGDESMMAAAQFLLDLMEIRDNLGTLALWFIFSFNEVYDIIVPFATQ